MQAEEQKVFNVGSRMSKLKHPYKVYLSGHTDSIGNDEDNKSMSRKRVVTVSQTLERLGANASSIEMGSFGESQPIIFTCEGIKTLSTRNAVT